MRFILIAAAAFFFTLPAQAVPITIGGHIAGLVGFGAGPDEPCCIESVLTLISSDFDISTSGAGEASGELGRGEGELIFSAIARVPGPSGSAVVTGEAEFGLTLTNTNPEAITAIEVVSLDLIAADLEGTGVEVFVDDPELESALWRSQSIASEQPNCFDPEPINLGGSCALQSHIVAVAAPPSEVVPVNQVDFPVAAFSLAPGESRSFFLTLQDRAEATRVPEPHVLALLSVGLVGLGLAGWRRHRNAGRFGIGF